MANETEGWGEGMATGLGMWHYFVTDSHMHAKCGWAAKRPSSPLYLNPPKEERVCDCCYRFWSETALAREQEGQQC